MKLGSLSSRIAGVGAREPDAKLALADEHFLELLVSHGHGGVRARRRGATVGRLLILQIWLYADTTVSSAEP